MHSIIGEIASYPQEIMKWRGGDENLDFGLKFISRPYPLLFNQTEKRRLIRKMKMLTR